MTSMALTKPIRRAAITAAVFAFTYSLPNASAETAGSSTAIVPTSPTAPGEELKNAEEHGHSSFRLLTHTCHGEDSAGPESTPQSPPLNVDDPATPGCNRWEINVVADGDFAPRDRQYDLPLLDINYGIGDNIQLKYEVPYSRSTNDANTTSSVGDSKVGVKYSFFNDEVHELEMGFYPQVTLINPPSDSAGSRKLQTQTTLPLLLTKKLGKTRLGDLDLTADLAYTLSKKPGTPDYVSGSIALGSPLTDRIGIMGEIATDQSFALDPEGTRQSIVKADLGLVTTISKKFLLFGAIGHSIATSDNVGHAYGLVGFRVLAGTGVPNDPVVVQNTY